MKVAGLGLTLIVMGFLVWLAYGRKDAESAASVQAASSATLGAAPPSDVAKNLPAAKAHVVHQTCLADCAGEERTCAAVALDPAGSDACVKAKSACEAQCP